MLEAVPFILVIIASSCRLIISSSASHGRGRRDRTRDRIRDSSRDRTRDRARDCTRDRTRDRARDRAARRAGEPRKMALFASWCPIVTYKHEPNMSSMQA